MANDIWINGELANNVSVLDRGFSYGDGLFTTIKVDNYCCELLPQHIDRLQQGLIRLSIAAIDFEALSNDLTTKAKNLQNGILKVTITRGIGQRGYSSLGCDSPTVVISTSPMTTSYLPWQKEGINLGISTITLGINPLTAGLKHLNRLEQVLIKQQIDENKWADAVVLDCNGHVIETNMANIFLCKDNIVYTPCLKTSGVNGLMRQQVINYLDDNNIDIIEDRFKLGAIMNADEIFITNCLMGVVPITAVESTTFSIGKMARKLSLVFNEKECS